MLGCSRYFNSKCLRRCKARYNWHKPERATAALNQTLNSRNFHATKILHHTQSQSPISPHQITLLFSFFFFCLSAFKIVNETSNGNIESNMRAFSRQPMLVMVCVCIFHFYFALKSTKHLLSSCDNIDMFRGTAIVVAFDDGIILLQYENINIRVSDGFYFNCIIFVVGYGWRIHIHISYRTVQWIKVFWPIVKFLLMIWYNESGRRVFSVFPHVVCVTSFLSIYHWHQQPLWRIITIYTYDMICAAAWKRSNESNV